MRFLRSIASCALALCLSAFTMMPASAAVPIDPGLHAVAAIGICHPSPAILDVDHVAIAPDRQVVTAASHFSIRSTRTLKTASFARAFSRKLSAPDIRMRC